MAELYGPYPGLGRDITALAILRAMMRALPAFCAYLGSIRWRLADLCAWNCRAGAVNCKEHEPTCDYHQVKAYPAEAILGG